VIRVSLIIAAFTLANSALAADGDKLVYGAGMISCAEWQKFRTTGDKANSYQAQAWVDGFLSGENSAGDGIDFLAPKPNTIAYYAWIDNYCAQNPLYSLVQATWLLKKELIARTR